MGSSRSTCEGPRLAFHIQMQTLSGCHRRILLRTFGGTPNRGPCSLWGLIWGLPKDIGLSDDYIRVIYDNGIKGPY